MPGNLGRIYQSVSPHTEAKPSNLRIQLQNGVRQVTALMLVLRAASIRLPRQTFVRLPPANIETQEDRHARTTRESVNEKKK